MRSRSLFGVALALVGAATTLHAAGEGAMRVKVLKPDHTPLVGVEIRAQVAVASPTQINSAIVVRTNEKGIADFYKLSPGMFTVQVQADGYQAGVIRTDVQTDRMSHLSIVLRPLPVVEIAVTDAVEGIDPTTVTTGAVRKGVILELTPIDTFRRFSDKLLLSPNVFRPGLEFGADPVLVNSVGQDAFGGLAYSNNTYVLDGMDISSPILGTGRSGIPDSAIAEVEVKTGGITAEYVARSGAFLQVLTISGSNTFAGEVSHEFTTPGFQAKVGRNRPEAYAENGVLQQATVSGPIVKNKVWFAASVFRNKKVQNVNPMQMVPMDETGAFIKGTWQVSPANRLVLEYHSDYRNQNNASPGLVPNRVVNYERGGERWIGWYSFQASNLMVDLKVGRNTTRNHDVPLVGGGTVDVYGPEGTGEFGGFSVSGRTWAKRDQIRLDVAIPFSTGAALHFFKAGAERNTDSLHDKFDWLGYVQNQANPVAYAESMGPTPIVYPASYIAMVANAYPAVVAAIASNGVEITADDIMGYRFTELDNPSRPELGYRYSRTIQTSSGQVSTTKKVHTGFFVQDAITMGRIALLPGFRWDKYALKNDRGETMYEFSGNFAPRFGVSVDPEGNGQSKVFGYYGRYFDPCNADVYSAIGGTKGPGISDQIWLAGEWVDLYSSTPVNNVVLDNAKFPHTDELRLGYERSFRVGGSTYNLSGSWARRKDYDSFGKISVWDYTSTDALDYYAMSQFGIWDAPTPAQANVIQAFRNLQLPVEFFASRGRSGQAVIDHAMATGASVYGTIPGQWRDHRTFDLTLVRPLQNKWGGMVSYTWNKSRGNSIAMNANSPVGSMPVADPRLPYNSGTLEGSLDWLAKAYLYYKGEKLSLGVSGNWNSGTHYSLSQPYFSGNLLNVTDAESFYVPHRGSFRTPSVSRYDATVAYRLKLGKVLGEVKASVYNLFNDQATIREAEGQFVRTGYEFGQGYIFQEPRKVYLGMSLKF